MTKTTEVFIPVSGGRNMRALLIEPDVPNSNKAGVIAIHDIFGYTPDIQRIGERLAAEGYPTLVPDLYDQSGSKPMCVVKTLTAHERGKGHAFSMLEAARLWLLEQTSVQRVGMMGFCMGGRFAMLYAAQAPISVVAPFYGGVPSKAKALAGICPVVGGWGETDMVYGQHGKRLEKHLEILGVEHDVKTYADVGHSYMNNHDTFIFKELGDYSPLRSKYDEEASEDSWQRVLVFFDRVFSREQAAG